MRILRGDRLVKILILLQAHGRITTKDLAEKLEVSERTIHRDMDALSTSGIPMYAERGKNGGWALVDDYKTNLTGLKEEEIRSLFLSPSEQLLEDLGLTRTFENARNKLAASVPSLYRESAKSIWERIYVYTTTWRVKKEKIRAFETLKKAIWNDRKLKITYRRADGQSVERLVNPLGLVAKGSRWYLAAAKPDGELRSYRVSRILTAEETEEIFKRPVNFNLGEYWKSSTKDFIESLPTYKILADIRTSILPRMRFTDRFVQVEQLEEEEREGWVSVSLTFNTEEEALGYILSFNDKIRVYKPADLPKKIVKLVEATKALYK
ncbi:helix-turn-helix transcriptional regulator [Halobacillus massiliensis]|uniref:helix-turn-helix transcriptional regulator n=1 Tax=Halobacillus massiliensis TaxID=1926286 RepID=UPI001FE347E1|nr:YafY family protein [Halobacillus massiliensis]